MIYMEILNAPMAINVLIMMNRNVKSIPTAVSGLRMRRRLAHVNPLKVLPHGVLGKSDVRIVHRANALNLAADG
jgi:hypothetical protein